MSHAPMSGGASNGNRKGAWGVARSVATTDINLPFVKDAVGRILLRGVDFGRVQFFARELGLAVSKRRDSALTVRAAAPGEVGRLLECSYPERTPEGLGDRFQRGDECFVAEDDAGRLVHTGWLTTTRGYIPELDVDLALRPGEGYMYDAYAPPDRRGYGAFGLVLDYIFHRLELAGFTRVYSYVRGDNHVGLAGAPRRLRPAGTLWYLRVGDRHMVFGRRESVLPLLVSRERPQGQRRPHAESVGSIAQSR